MAREGVYIRSLVISTGSFSSPVANAKGPGLGAGNGRHRSEVTGVSATHRYFGVS